MSEIVKCDVCKEIIEKKKSYQKIVKTTLGDKYEDIISLDLCDRCEINLSNLILNCKAYYDKIIELNIKIDEGEDDE